jgi:hypothetical protein
MLYIADLAGKSTTTGHLIYSKKNLDFSFCSSLLTYPECGGIDKRTIESESSLDVVPVHALTSSEFEKEAAELGKSS